MAFQLTPKQREANHLLAGNATHIMLFGGSRSGKTLLLCRAIATRALKAEHSRHAILRHRFNHVKASIWHDTWPKMMRLCYPDVPTTQDKSDWFIRFPNKSEVWFGGLDDKERTEKILGQEHSSILLNECSQISFAAREMARTRLAQNVGLKLKLYSDENPPLRTHWTHRLFIEKRSPEPPYNLLPNPENYASLLLNPADNAENLPASYLKELQSLSPRARMRFWEGKFGDAAENALWVYETIARYRVEKHPDLQRIVVAVDPSGTSGADDERSDHVGIVVAGLGIDGEAYVLEDLTVKGPPAVWGRVVATAYERHNADRVVGETNFGGAMVAHVIKSADPNMPFREVTASRGKVVRAEPISALYDKGKVHHVGVMPELEDQLCVMAGTLVETQFGQRPIEQIRAGDYVMTRSGLAPVKWVGQTGFSRSLIRIETPASWLKCTPSHPVFVADKFVAAQSVKPSDCLLVSRRWAETVVPSVNAVRRGRQLNSARDCFALTGVTSVQDIVVAEPVPVYNLEIENGFPPEFFANGILVHNCAFTTSGYMGDKSPDRADALVWALTDLFPGMTRKRRDSAVKIEGVGDYRPHSF